MTLHGPLQNFHFSGKEMLKNMDILPIEDIYKLELGKFMHRVHAKNLPENFENYFKRIQNMHNYPLRSIRNKAFYPKSTNTAKYQNWLTNAGVELWWDLDPGIKNLPYKSFAQKYKQNLLDTY